MLGLLFLSLEQTKSYGKSYKYTWLLKFHTKDKATMWGDRGQGEEPSWKQNLQPQLP